MTTDATPGSPSQAFAFIVCSVDGFIEDGQKRLDWSTAEPEVFTWNNPEARHNPRVSAMLLGRNTYDHFADFWPSEAAFNDFPKIAEFMRETPKHVVTSRPESLPVWNGAKPVDGKNLKDAVTTLKETHDDDIAVFGSPTLAAQLLEQALLDELRILINPVALGAGTKLFEGLGRRVPLITTSATTFPSGNALLTYTPQVPQEGVPA
ncbi:dihydrofolate reductase [Nesterenkonia sp. MY13]|uniref:Dihydrofolate reductase n=1 Tax=Nesterenkonia sedimenti TaxID=1463632 RepID=A0A7X8TGW2_9MICC|nr:dihydrofolate reductase family protein [Nesterenkonia sedimenti]NLS08502.1 dihydrofolate reductase [Nesterenkonia sedimenti]